MFQGDIVSKLDFGWQRYGHVLRPLTFTDEARQRFDMTKISRQSVVKKMSQKVYTALPLTTHR